MEHFTSRPIIIHVTFDVHIKMDGWSERVKKRRQYYGSVANKKFVTIHWL